VGYEIRGSGASGMMDPHEFTRRHREEVAREVQRNHLERELRRSRRRRFGASHRAPAPAWELRRIVGRLRKLFKPFGDTR
jgi:hypothetical protein